MASYERSYETARTVFSILEFAGWIFVGIGVIAVLGSSANGGVGGIFGVMFGIGMVIVGLISVAFVQSSRANVDTAEMTRDLLSIARGDSMSAGVTSSPISNADEEKTRQPVKEAEPIKNTELVKEVEPVIANSDPVSPDRPTEPARYCGSHKGVEISVAIVSGEELFFVEDNSFESYAAAKAFIDETHKAKTRPNEGEKRLAETFMGIEIFQKHDGHYIKNRWFANLNAAKAFVKRALDEEAKSKTRNDEDH